MPEGKKIPIKCTVEVVYFVTTRLTDIAVERLTNVGSNLISLLLISTL